MERLAQASSLVVPRQLGAVADPSVPEVPAVLVVGYVVLLALVAATLAHHFAARCPVCHRHIGFQQSLGLPDTCEVCRTQLHS